MNFNSLLNDVLKVAQKAGGELGTKVRQGDTSTLSKLTGAGAVGALATVLGRKVGGSSLVKAGSVAALGALAYHAYQKYSADKAEPNQLPQTAFQPDQDEQAGRTILRAMIAAAASDGEIDAQERALIQQESGDDVATQTWLARELSQPATVAELAHDIRGNTALAAEAYLAARLVCGELSRKEIVFLAQLASAVNLDDKLVEQLEKQAGF